MNSKVNIFLALIIVALICCLFRTCGNASKYKDLADAQNDTLRTAINEKGQHIATIAALTGSVADLKRLNAGKDSALLRLQQLVDKHTVSATVHGTVTGNTFTSGTSVKYDTIKLHDSIEVNATFFTDYQNRWERFSITANVDSFHVAYKVFNEFDYQVRYNKQKWYKLRVPEITVTNINPHTETLVLKNFVVTPPPNQKIIVFLGGLTTGAVATIAASIFIHSLIPK